MRIITLVALAAAVLLASCSLELRDPDVASAQFVIQQAPSNVTSIVFVATNSAGEVRKYEISPTARAFKTELVAGVYVFELIMSVPTGTLTAITKAEISPGEAIDLNMVMSHQSRMLAIPDLLNNRLTIFNRTRDLSSTNPREELRTVTLKHLQAGGLAVKDFWPRDIEFSRGGEIVVLSDASRTVGYVASIDDSLGTGATMILDMNNVDPTALVHSIAIDDLTNTLFVSLTDSKGTQRILRCQLRNCMATRDFKLDISLVTNTPIRGMDFHERYGVLLLAYGDDSGTVGSGAFYRALDPATGRIGNEIQGGPSSTAGWDIRVIGDRAYGVYADAFSGGGVVELAVSGTDMKLGAANTNFAGARRILDGTDKLIIIDEESSSDLFDRLVELYNITDKGRIEFGEYGSAIDQFIFFESGGRVAA